MEDKPADESADSAAYVPLARLDDLPDGKQLSVYFGLRRVLLCNVGGTVFAIKDMCPHLMQPLLGGKIENNVIRCPKHGASFDLTSGCPTNSVTRATLEIYPVRIREGQVEVAVK